MKPLHPAADPDPFLDPASPPAESAASGKLRQRGVWIMLLGLAGFVVWAALAPLDEGVPTDGVVNVEGNHKVVQHHTGGIVRELRVREGQQVTAGEVLVVLDDTNARARAEEIRQQYLGLRAQESRLRAEKLGSASIVFHADVLAAQDDASVRQQMQNETQLLMARQQAMQADIASLQEAIAGQEALISGYEGLLASYNAQRGLLNEQLNQLRTLVAEGYAPRNQQIELEQRAAQLEGQIAETIANRLRSQKSILETQQRIQSRRQLERKEIDGELSQASLAIQTAIERYKPLKEDLRRVEIVATSSGQVVGLQVHTVGAVIQPGQKILDIVPAGEPLILDARIPPHLIDKIHVGQAADVRFSTFANTPQLLLEGTIKTVSSDLFTEPASATGQAPASYYLARVAITEKGMQQLGQRVLQPGMPVQVVIRSGERSLLTYLLHPLTKRIAAAMKEE
ncbi:HlyD family type I secretion periplasmic adaptor subunit [Methylobacillus flagellatus]|uniref:HlyD family type I secretion periplasmic adaptor subunit n=1 Tax=Methylobacillus flagellatus TaxID=405 RepID=UPI0010F8F32D|nr:HlyD family type I secretion periplasmic adaptor subunit [Methylobacillus flagellatus]